MAGHDNQPFFPSFTSKGLDTSTGQQIDLGALYDKQKKLATDFKIPKTYAEAEVIYGPNLVGAPTSIKSIIKENLKTTIPEGKEKVRMFGKEVAVDKDRPEGLARIKAGLADFINLQNYYMGTGEQTDYDKRGGFTTEDGYDPLEGLQEFDYKLSPIQQKVIESDLTEQFGKEPSPTEGLKDAMKLVRDERRLDRADQIRAARRMGLEAFANYAVTELPRQMFINRAEEIANQRFLRTKFALEATPTKIQDIMTAKQAQQGIAALSEAERAKAVAEQQKAANEFGAPQVTLARNVRFANAAFKA